MSGEICNNHIIYIRDKINESIGSFHSKVESDKTRCVMGEGEIVTREMKEGLVNGWYRVAEKISSNFFFNVEGSCSGQLASS